MYQGQRTEFFDKWLTNLRDIRAKARRLARVGYRLYFTRRHRIAVILLCGGEKSSQSKDIARARLMVQEME